MKLTAHSYHNVYDNIASVLMWPADERTEMGRWAFLLDQKGHRRKAPGAQKIMHARYASAASAANQIALRTRIVKAVAFLISDWLTLPLSSVLTPLTESPKCITHCEYYGPAGCVEGVLNWEEYSPQKLARA